LGNRDPKPESLVFPRGVRFPRKDEVPRDSSEEILTKVAKARITTGYIITTAEDQLFNTYLEANVHAPKVFDIFRQLAFALMPDVAAPLIGIKGEEPVFGPYTDRAWAIGIFEPYVDLLQNDGFLEFGIVHQSDLAFEEVFVASPKYFKIWTNNGDSAEQILRNNNIPRCETLEFIDEYPMVSSSVDGKGNAAWAGPFNAIQDAFPKLPQASAFKDEQ